MSKLVISGIAFVVAAWIAAPAQGISCSSLPRYVYRADKQTFEDANQICLDMGARLAIANTVNEAILLSNLAQHSQDTFQIVFVGRFFDGRFWQTVDESLVSDSGYVGWMAGEPIYMQKYETIVPCGAIGWNAVHIDVRCEDPRPFICEFYKKPCTNP